MLILEIKMQNKKTIIVDADPSIRSIFEFMLQQAGYEACSAPDATSCLQRIENDPNICLIFLDINTQDISNKTILKEIHNKKPNLMIILVTSDNFVETFHNGYQEGAYGVICKPFDIEEVLSIVKKVLDKN